MFMCGTNKICLYVTNGDDTNPMHELAEWANRAFVMPPDDLDDDVELQRAYDKTWENLDTNRGPLEALFGSHVRIEDDTIDMADWVFVVYVQDNDEPVAFINWDLDGDDTRNPDYVDMYVPT